MDLLAWQLHVDFWDPDASLTVKRDIIKNSIPWHRRKGTPSAVEEGVPYAVDEITNMTVSEWFDYGGDPYKFKVSTSDSMDLADLLTRCVAAINILKNTRSWLDSLIIDRDVYGTTFDGGVTHTVIKQTVKAA